jgi:hypothetical protein
MTHNKDGKKESTIFPGMAAPEERKGFLRILVIGTLVGVLAGICLVGRDVYRDLQTPTRFALSRAALFDEIELGMPRAEVQRLLKDVAVDPQGIKEGKYVFKDFWWMYSVSIDSTTDRVSRKGFFPRRVHYY